MVLNYTGDIFGENIEFQSKPGILTIISISGALRGQNTLYVKDDENLQSDLANTISTIQKTINDGYKLRKGMINFLKAYMQSFPTGKYYQRAKEYLKHK